MRQLAWVQGLPEIIEAIQGLIEVQGHDHSGNCGGDELWAGEHGRGVDVSGLSLDVEGYDEGGPYRIMVFAESMDGSPNGDEPLLKLEIRPSLIWINEVKRLAAEAKTAEPVTVG